MRRRMVRFVLYFLERFLPVSHMTTMTTRPLIGRGKSVMHGVNRWKIRGIRLLTLVTWLSNQPIRSHRFSWSCIKKRYAPDGCLYHAQKGRQGDSWPVTLVTWLPANQSETGSVLLMRKRPPPLHRYPAVSQEGNCICVARHNSAHAAQNTASVKRRAENGNSFLGPYL
jgi:hypothetical protein